MPSISPLIVRVFDSPHAMGRHNRRANRDRLETKGRVAKRRSR